MALDYVQGLAGAAAVEMSDTGSCRSVCQWIHLVIMTADLPAQFLFSLIEHSPLEGSGLPEEASVGKRHFIHF